MQIHTRLKTVGSSLLHWTWVPALLYWIVFSAGIFSELAFLIASVWKSVNASDHEFVRLFMSELQSQQTTYWANSAYIILSVCILPLAAITTYGHVRTWIYERKWFCAPALWATLYGLPTLTFLVIDIAIISSSSPTYSLPDLLVSARSIMAYAYGLTAILYHYVGKPQEVDRLKQKDLFIDQLEGQIRNLMVQMDDQKTEMERQKVSLAENLGEQIRNLTEQIDDQRTEMERQKVSLAESKAAHKRALEEAQKSDEEALRAYGDDFLQWLKSGVKTATVEEIMQITGLSKRKINGANLARSPRNHDLIMISALVTWLKTLPIPTAKERNTESLPISNGHDKETVNLNEYLDLLV